MIAYLIPKSRRFNEIVMVDVGDEVPRLLKVVSSDIFPEVVPRGIIFDLETRTDIAVYKEREERPGWLS